MQASFVDDVLFFFGGIAFDLEGYVVVPHDLLQQFPMYSDADIEELILHYGLPVVFRYRMESEGDVIGLYLHGIDVSVGIEYRPPGLTFQSRSGCLHIQHVVVSFLALVLLQDIPGVYSVVGEERQRKHPVPYAEGFTSFVEIRSDIGERKTGTADAGARSHCIRVPEYGIFLYHVRPESIQFRKCDIYLPVHVYAGDTETVASPPERMVGYPFGVELYDVGKCHRPRNGHGCLAGVDLLHFLDLLHVLLVFHKGIEQMACGKNPTFGIYDNERPA